MSTIELQEVLCRVVQVVRKVVDADIVALYPLIDGVFQTPVIDGARANHEFDLLPRPGGITTTVLERGFVVVEDLVKHPEMGSRFSAAERIRSFAGVALRAGGEVVNGEVVSGHAVGVVYVDFRSLHPFPEDECNIIQLFAAQAAIAIQNAQLFDQRVEDLNALATISSEAVRCSNLDMLLDRILEAALALLGAPNGIIMLVDESKEYLQVRAMRGALWPDYTQKKFKIGEHGVSGWVAEHKQTALIPDVRAKEWQDIYIAVLPDTLSQLATPLLDENDELLGVINLESPALSAFSRYDQALLQSLADQAVIAIENQRRYEAGQRAR